MMLSCIGNLVAQSLFTVETVDGSRPYLLYVKGERKPNLPLVLVLHDQGSTARESFRSEVFWDSLFTSEIILGFPHAQNRHWGCNDQQVRNDTTYLNALLSAVFKNYHINRNRVFIVAEGESLCLAKYMLETHSSMNQIIPLSDSIDIRNFGTQLEKSLNSEDSDQIFDLWQPVSDNEEANSASLELLTWKDRLTLDLSINRFSWLGITTNFDTNTLIDFSSHHTFLNLKINKWLTDSLALKLDIGWLIVPRNMEIKDRVVTNGGTIILGEGNGGAIVPLTVGVKFAKRVGAVRYKLETGVGISAILAAGGNIATSTGLSPEAIGEQLDFQTRWPFTFSLGSGLELRLSRRIANALDISYIHSSRISPLGSISAIRAISVGYSFTYILGFIKD